MITWKATLVFFCIFLAGGVSGGFVGMRLACDAANKQAVKAAEKQHPPRRPVDDHQKRKQKELVTRLDVTAEQQAKTEPVIQAAMIEYRNLREQWFQRAADITDRMDEQIMALLTPEQKPKFEEMIAERKEKYKKDQAERAARYARPPPPPDGPPPAPAKEH